MRISTAELEQRQLLRLHRFATADRPPLDGWCPECGLRRSDRLCGPCEDRRARLAERYPEIRIQQLTAAATDYTREFQPIRDLSADTWIPHNSE